MYKSDGEVKHCNEEKEHFALTTLIHKNVDNVNQITLEQHLVNKGIINITLFHWDF